MVAAQCLHSVGYVFIPIHTSLLSSLLSIGFFSLTYAYGFTYGLLSTTSQLDTTYAIVAALIAMDTPRQVRWHLENARRGGATLEETKAVRAWLWEQMNQYVEFLGELLQDEEAVLRVRLLDTSVLLSNPAHACCIDIFSADPLLPPKASIHGSCHLFP